MAASRQPLVACWSLQGKLADIVLQPGVLMVGSAPAPSQHFLAARHSHRHRFSAFYDRWDLGPTGVAQAGTAGRPIEAILDDMYVPLRLGEGYDLRELRKEHVLIPQNLRRLK